MTSKLIKGRYKLTAGQDGIEPHKRVEERQLASTLVRSNCERAARAR